jgi:hypothetical protein
LKNRHFIFIWITIIINATYHYYYKILKITIFYNKNGLDNKY